MNKLYWIVCEENHTTLFEGRFQGRTRGSALKFLKEQIGRKSLSGVVFTITEIPVPLIRQIVAEFLTEAGIPVSAAPPEGSNVVPAENPPEIPKARPAKAQKVKTPDAPKDAAPVKPSATKGKGGKKP